MAGPAAASATLPLRVRARFARWVETRQGPDALPVTLARRRLYILPTAAGCGFAGLLLLMLIAGLNYGNSLALFVTFLLGAFALVAMQECHRNLLGTTLGAAAAPPAFAGGPAALHLTLLAPAGRAQPRLEAAIPAGTPAAGDVPEGGELRLTLAFPAARRGRVRLPRLKLSTAHPFGLFRAWTWIHAPLEILVYPKPQGALPLPYDAARGGGAHRDATPGADEWRSLRPFRAGDSPRQVDWKAYAREAPLLVKEYVQAQSGSLELDFEKLSTPDVEARLSQLARWVLDAEARGEAYALSLPGVRIAAGAGSEHRGRCLAALACFGEDAER